jgi:hypothetical protein
VSGVGSWFAKDSDAPHALMGTLPVRELSLAMGALGALVNAMDDQLDTVCLGQGLPPLAHDMMRQWLAVLDQSEHL